MNIVNIIIAEVSLLKRVKNQREKIHSMNSVIHLEIQLKERGWKIIGT